jgi:hypothetical protein
LLALSMCTVFAKMPSLKAKSKLHTDVIPAKAGIHFKLKNYDKLLQIPRFFLPK